MRFARLLTHPPTFVPAGALVAATLAMLLWPTGFSRLLELAPGVISGLLGKVVPIAAPILVLLLPIRAAPLAFVWILLLPLLIVVHTSVVPHFHEGNNAPFDLAFTLFWWLGIFVLTGVLLLIRVAILGGRQMLGRAAEPRRLPSWIVPPHLWVLAAFVAMLLQFSIVQGAQGLRPAWLPHLLMLAVAIGILAASRLAFFDGIGSTLRAWLSGFAWGLLVCLGLEVGMSGIAMHESRRIAGDRPYCLQSAEHGPDYQVVRSPLDLSALTMQAKASGPIYLQHHAVLVIRAAAGPEILHWSYNRRTFLRADGMLAPVVHCEPVPGFLDRLTWLGVTPGGSSAASLISMAGHSFRIPADYQPKASSANADIRIAAMAPDFAPLADPPEKGGGVLRLAYVTFDPYRYALAREKESGTDIAPEHGLAKRIFRTGSLTITRYTSGESNGHPDVTIECQLRGCDFLFVRDGVGYAFEADATLLPRWRELRDRLEALFDSWRVEP